MCTRGKGVFCCVCCSIGGYVYLKDATDHNSPLLIEQWFIFGGQPFVAVMQVEGENIGSHYS